MHDKNKLGNLQGNVADTDVLDEITVFEIKTNKINLIQSRNHRILVSISRH